MSTGRLPFLALFLCGSFALLSRGFAGETTLVGPACPGLFEPTARPEDLEVPPAFEDPNFVSGADAIAGAAARKDWTSVSGLLRQGGIPNRVETWTFDGKTYGGVLLDLDAPSEDPLMRAIRRLRAKWAALESEVGRPGEFVKIILVDDAALAESDSVGAYFRGENAIRIGISRFDRYFFTGDFPSTLSHELRHAGFDRFELARFARGRNFYSSELRNAEGRLAAGGAYGKFASAEEAYTHLRDFREKLRRTRERIAALVGKSPGRLDARTAAALEGGLISARLKAKSALGIAAGVKADLVASLEAAAQGKAEISIPMGEAKILISHARNGHLIRTTLYCPECATWAWLRKMRAKEVIRRMNASANARLGEIEAGLEKALADLSALEKATRLAARGEDETILTGAETLRRYDAVLAAIADVIRKEPRF